MKNLFSALIAVGALTGCINTTHMGHGADRKQLMLLSQDQVVEQAKRKFTQKTGLIEKEYLSEAEIRCAKIMNRIIPYTDHYISADRTIKWGVHLYHSDKSNAGALANGMIFISHKMVNRAMLDDEALAYILAHEMAHVIREHQRETQSWKYIVSPLLVGTAWATAGTSALITGVLHDGYGSTYQRRMEKEADLLGLELMARAGYNPKQGIAVFAQFYPTFLKEYPIQSKLPAFMQRHPSLKQRLKYAEENLDSSMALYDKSTTEQLSSKNLIEIKQDPNTRLLINGQLVRNIDIESITKDTEGKLHYVLKSNVQTSVTSQSPVSQPKDALSTVKRVL